MATWKVEGMEEYIRLLERLDRGATGTIKRAVYDGAGVVADAMKSAMLGIRTDDADHYKDDIKSGPTSEEKSALIAGFGVARMTNDNGYINTKVGFHGKNVNGMSNSGVARQIESGTSWMSKQPVFTRAINASRGKAEQAMAAAFDRAIQKYVK